MADHSRQAHRRGQSPSGRRALGVAGAAPPVRPTDLVRGCAIGDCADVPVDYVSVAFENASIISGQVTPGEATYLETTPRYPFATRPAYPQIEGGAKKYWYSYTGELSPGPDGRFRLADADLPPPYRPWRVADLESVRVWSAVDDGHYLVAVAAPRRAIYLPRAEVGRRGGP